MKVYTVEEVAEILKLENKTVLRLIKRGFLKALPGIRHKRITEEELKRYLGVKSILGSGPAASQNGCGQPDVRLSDRSSRPSSGDGISKGQIVDKTNGEGRGVACRVLKPNETT